MKNLILCTLASLFILFSACGEEEKISIVSEFDKEEVGTFIVELKSTATLKSQESKDETNKDKQSKGIKKDKEVQKKQMSKEEQELIKRYKEMKERQFEQRIK